MTLRRNSRLLARVAVAALCLAPGTPLLQAQGKADAAATALSEALSAACRQDVKGFAGYLTADNAAAFLNLPPAQRDAMLKRFLLLEDPGKPLLSATADGHLLVRCDAQGVVSEVRFGATRQHDNLAYIPVEVPKAGEGAQSGRFGLVREDGQWKLLSLGLLLLDVPQLAQQWEQADTNSRYASVESEVMDSLRKIAAALGKYREAFGRLPDALAQLGPGKGGDSPDQAGLLDGELASGESNGYRFRYNIVAAGGNAPEADRDRLAGFQLAATPEAYGKNGRRSFYLDDAGNLRGADKQGSVATSSDPRITPPVEPSGDTQP